jgi:hypothetical protein
VVCVVRLLWDTTTYSLVVFGLRLLVLLIRVTGGVRVAIYGGYGMIGGDNREPEIIFRCYKGGASVTVGEKRYCPFPWCDMCCVCHRSCGSQA